MSTPENDPLNPEKPSDVPAPPQYGQRAPQDPNAAGQPQYGQPPQYGAQQPNPYGQNPVPYGQPAPANNPYGQPAPANNPYGQPAPANSPYGQQPYAGGFPVPPQGNFAPPQMPTHRPKELKISFWLIIAAGIANLAGSIVLALSTTEASIRESFTMFVEIFPQLEQQLDANAMDLSAMARESRISLVITGVIALMIYVLIAFMVRKGSGVARIFATIFAVLSLFSLFSGLLMALSVVLGVVGVVFAWLRPSSQYIAARRAARAAGYR